MKNFWNFWICFSLLTIFMSVIYRLSPYFMVSVRQRSFTSLTPGNQCRKSWNCVGGDEREKNDLRALKSIHYSDQRTFILKSTFCNASISKMSRNIIRYFHVCIAEKKKHFWVDDFIGSISLRLQLSILGSRARTLSSLFFFLTKMNHSRRFPCIGFCTVAIYGHNWEYESSFQIISPISCNWFFIWNPSYLGNVWKLKTTSI